MLECPCRLDRPTSYHDATKVRITLRCFCGTKGDMDDGFEMNLTQRREGARTQRAVANDSFVMIFMVCSKCYLK